MLTIMNYGKRIALIRPPARSTSTECDSMMSCDDIDDEKDSLKRSSRMDDLHCAKIKKTRNLSEKKRRDQFNMLINELCSMVSTNNKKMDKSTVLKSAISFLRNHQEISVQSRAYEIKEDWKPPFLSNDEFSQLMLEALDSFLILFTQEGKILYVSESVTSLLGHLPADLINRSLFDFVHESERVNLYNLLSSHCLLGHCDEPDFDNDENKILFPMHMRRGSIDPSDQFMYEYVRLTGSARSWNGEIGDMDSYTGMSCAKESTVFCCTIRLQMSHIIREMSVVDDSMSEFTSRHSLEWKFLFLDHRAPPIIGYLPFEVLGTSGYDYYHPDDLEKVSKYHEQLMQTGEGTSCYYRFLTKGQQWIWLKTRYYITYHQWNSKPEFIVCTNTLVDFSDVRVQLRKDLGYSQEDVEAMVMDSVAADKQTPSGAFSSSQLASLLTTSHVLSPQEPTPSNLSPPAQQQQPQPQQQQPQPQQAQQQVQQVQQLLQPQVVQATLAAPQTLPQPSITSQLQTLLQQHLLQQQQQQQQQQLQQQLQQQQQQLQQPLQQPLQQVVTSAVRLQRAKSAMQTSSTLTKSQQASQIMQNLLPIMALTPGIVTMPTMRQVQQNDQPTSIVSSLSPSPVMTAVATSTQPLMTPQLYLTPAQQLLHDQLLQKSQSLQQTIQRQQQELQQITEQLSRARAQTMMPPFMAASPTSLHAAMAATTASVLLQSTSPSMQPAQQQPRPPQPQALPDQSGSTPVVSQVKLLLPQQPNQYIPFQIVPQDAEMVFADNDLSDSW